MAIYSRKDFERAYLAVPRRTGFYRRYFKRTFDILFVLAIALPVGLIVAVLAIVIARDGASPIYRQERVGLNGKRFSMLKLRSMVPDADAKLEVYLHENPEARREWDEKQKLLNDPRITPIGRLIRKTSLDRTAAILERAGGRHVGGRTASDDDRTGKPLSRNRVLCDASGHYRVLANR